MNDNIRAIYILKQNLTSIIFSIGVKSLISMRIRKIQFQISLYLCKCMMSRTKDANKDYHINIFFFFLIPQRKSLLRFKLVKIYALIIIALIIVTIKFHQN